jgi:hypothetical protein
MTLDLFQRLLPRAQLLHLLHNGTYLARRWEEEGMVALYHLPDDGRGFFAEVGRDALQQGSTVLSSFSSSMPLED